MRFPSSQELEGHLPQSCLVASSKTCCRGNHDASHRWETHSSRQGSQAIRRSAALVILWDCRKPRLVACQAFYPDFSEGKQGTKAETKTGTRQGTQGSQTDVGSTGAWRSRDSDARNMSRLRRQPGPLDKQTTQKKEKNRRKKKGKEGK